MDRLIIFRCPATGLDVQTSLPLNREEGDQGQRHYDSINCPACLHAAKPTPPGGTRWARSSRRRGRGLSGWARHVGDVALHISPHPGQVEVETNPQAEKSQQEKGQ